MRPDPDFQMGQVLVQRRADDGRLRCILVGCELSGGWFSTLSMHEIVWERFILELFGAWSHSLSIIVETFVDMNMHAQGKFVYQIDYW